MSVCPVCGGATWNYNTAAGTRMCANGHQTDRDGNKVPFTVTYTQAAVPVTVAPPPPEPVAGVSRRAVAGLVFAAAACGAAVPVILEAVL